MSFYGNMTSSISQAFTRFLFKNTGKNKNEFLEEPEDGVYDANTSVSQVAIESGNGWVQLNPTDEGFAIYHSAPKEENLTMVQGFIPESEPPSDDYVAELDQGACLQVPVLYFDEAGHVSTTGEAVYYKLPIDDTVTNVNALMERMDQVDKTVEEQNKSIDAVKIESSSAKSTAENVSKSLGSISSITGSTKSLADCFGNLSKSIQEWCGDDNDSKTIKDVFSAISSAISNLDTDIGIVQIAVKSHDSTIDGLKDTVDELKEEIAKLKEQLNG